MVKIKEESDESDDIEVRYRDAESELDNENVEFYEPRTIRDCVQSILGRELEENVKPKIERIDIDPNRQPVIQLNRNYLKKNYRAKWIELVKATFRRPTCRKCCQLCNGPIKFTSATELIKHYANIHGRENSLFNCRLCDHSSKNEEDILEHWKTMHSHRKNIEKYTVTIEKNDPNNIWIGDDELVRSIFPKKLNIFASAEKRREYSKELVECDICSKNVSRQSLNIHMLLHGSEKYICDICGKSTRYKSYIKSHMFTHTNKKQFKCKICSKTFNWPQSFRMHEMLHFKDTLPENDPRLKRRKRERELVECDICKKKVGRKSLNLHKKTHIDELPNKCDECGKLFRRKSSLREHKYTHLEKKPFECKYCMQTFAQRRSMEHHELIHLKGVLPDDDPRWRWSDYKKKIVKCDICSKQVSAYHLKHHKRIHNNEKPFKCDICNRSFRMKSNMNLHKAVHSNKTPFSCTFCGNKFRNVSHLKVHERMHREGMPACQFCKKEFSSKAHVARHIRSYHFNLLRQQDKETGQLNELFQGIRTLECYKCKFTHIFHQVQKHIKKCRIGANFVQCPKCPRKFKSEPSLKNHINSHSRCICTSST